MKITEITTETDITRDDLLAAITEGESDLATLLEVENPTAEQIAEMTALNTAIDGGVARVGEMDAAVQAQADELQALRDARDARQAAAEAAEAEPEVEPQQPETDAVVEPEPVAEVVETAPVVEVAAPEAQAIAASSARANLAGRRPAPSPERTQKEPVVSRTPVLVASADNGLVAAGAPVTMKTFQEIAREKLQSARGAQARVTSKVGTFRIQADSDITVHEKSTADQMNDAIERAVSMDRVREKQPALTASAGSDAEALTAAGWCAPSETVYDLCEGGSREGLFELPEIQIDRGGINFTQGLDFSPLYSDATFGWDITEAEMDAGTFDKPCVSVPCPTFEEERLDAIGFCVTSDLLPKAAYPELEQAFIAEALIAFDHKKSRKRFAAAIATAGAAITAGTLGSVAASTLAAVELVVEGERRKYRWPSTAVMEAVVPHWLRLAFRADLSNRTGVTEFELSDADIARWFSIRGIRIQYIYDYTGYLLAPGVATMPAQAQVFAFKAGTYVEGAAPVISLSTIYDSVLLAENKNMALFFEQGVLLLKRCYGGRLINIPVCAAGRSGIANVACA